MAQHRAGFGEKPKSFPKKLTQGFDPAMGWVSPMAKRNPRPPTPEICPVCGEDVPPKALACPDCGACHKSGWREGALDEYDPAAPDSDFDYDEFVKEEFGKSRPAFHRVWWITALLLFIILGIGIFFGYN